MPLEPNDAASLAKAAAWHAVNVNLATVLYVHSLQARKPVRSRGLFWEQDCQRRSVAFDAMRAPPLQYDYNLKRRLAHKHSSVAQWQSIRLLTGGL